MKAEIDKTGYIRITAETIAEAFALRFITDNIDTRCDPCIRNDENRPPVLIDYSILDS